MADAIASFGRTPSVATVGDVVTATYRREGNEAKISVIDRKTQRDVADSNLMSDLPARAHQATNKAGTLSSSLARQLRAAAATETPTTIMVDGEEDLAVLPVVLLLDDGDVVLYGQPNEGVVVLQVDDELRDVVRQHLKNMEGPTDEFLAMLQKSAKE